MLDAPAGAACGRKFQRTSALSYQGTKWPKRGAVKVGTYVYSGSVQNLPSTWWWKQKTVKGCRNTLCWRRQSYKLSASLSKSPAYERSSAQCFVCISIGQKARCKAIRIHARAFLNTAQNVDEILKISVQVCTFTASWFGRKVLWTFRRVTNRRQHLFWNLGDLARRDGGRYRQRVSHDNTKFSQRLVVKRRS